MNRPLVGYCFKCPFFTPSNIDPPLVTQLGMDPYTRRALWETLKEIKRDRAIIMTTHLMEEADFLGDRIAIMAQGRVACLGSSMFLKSHFGLGYSISCSKYEHFTLAEENKIKKLVNESLPGSSTTSNIALSITFRAPFSASTGMPRLLETLDSDPRAYGINSFSVGLTTLEEVFLLVGRSKDADVEAMSKDDEERRRAAFVRESGRGGVGGVDGADPLNPPFATDSEGTPPTTPRQDQGKAAGIVLRTPSTIASARGKNGFDQTEGSPTYLSDAVDGSDLFIRLAQKATDMTPTRKFFWHMRALLRKQAKIAIRDYNGLLCQLLIPVMFVLICMGIVSRSSRGDPPSVALDASVYVNYPFENLAPTPFLYNSGGAQGLADTIMSNCNPNIDAIPMAFNTREELDDELVMGNTSKPKYMSAFFEEEASHVFRVDLFHNSTHRDSFPTALNTVVDCYLRGITPTAKVTLRNSPQQLASTLASSIYFVIIGLAFIPATWGMMIVRERVTNAKHSQHVAGLPISTYWFSNWLWDFIMYIPPATIILILLVAYKIDLLVSARKIGATITIFLLFGASVAPYSYLLAFAFSNPIACQMVLIVSGAFLPVVFSTIAFIPQTAAAWNLGVKYFAFLVPNVACSQALVNIALASKDVKIWHMDVVGLSVAYLLLEGFLYIWLVILIDNTATSTAVHMFVSKICRWCWCCKRRTPAGQTSSPSTTDVVLAGGAVISPSLGVSVLQLELDDEDVGIEKSRVKTLYNSIQEHPEKGGDESLLLAGLRKVFPPTTRKQKHSKVAVDDLWLQIPPGQCFGLLGANGSGKTTTTKMLTGSLVPTGGTAYVAGHNLVTHQKEAMQAAGYCPQFDALIDELTAREHIFLHARLNCVKDEHIGPFCDELVTQLGLETYQRRPSKRYSGGNKRKLSLGLSLIGDPKTVFLDEPSSGVDPAARRKLWMIISQTTRGAGRAVVLTTHSMDECEALCDRLAIMKDGALVCIGTPSQLKAKFGQTYQLEVTVIASRSNFEERLVQLTSFVTSTFPETKLVESMGSRQVWQIGRVCGMSFIFREMEAKKTDLHVRTYSVSETSLDQVFINFCRFGGHAATDM
eukprot:GHVN01020456.1.p1 GENE.GHVN01020456.1~~GHVN01020456.1.p1  ORF type:complete len:1099 (+),score=90.81 GHVN01020456.1:2938-6234(+)